jgi:hypothetical protein
MLLVNMADVSRRPILEDRNSRHCIRRHLNMLADMAHISWHGIWRKRWQVKSVGRLITIKQIDQDVSYTFSMHCSRYHCVSFPTASPTCHAKCAGASPRGKQVSIPGSNYRYCKTSSKLLSQSRVFLQIFAEDSTDI